MFTPFSSHASGRSFIHAGLQAYANNYRRLCLVGRQLDSMVWVGAGLPAIGRIHRGQARSLIRPIQVD